PSKSFMLTVGFFGFCSLRSSFLSSRLWCFSGLRVSVWSSTASVSFFIDSLFGKPSLLGIDEAGGVEISGVSLLTSFLKDSKKSSAFGEVVSFLGVDSCCALSSKVTFSLFTRCLLLSSLRGLSVLLS